MIATVYVHLPSSLFQHRYIHRFNDSNINSSDPIITIAAYSLTPTDVDSCSSDDSVSAHDLSIGSGSTIADTTMFSVSLTTSTSVDLP